MTSPADALSLLDLPPRTLVTVAAGYLAYRLAYTGKDGSHQTIDTVFLTFVFAAVAGAVMSFWGEQTDYGWSSSFVFAAAVIAALVVAAAWRKWGENLTFRGLRKAGVSASDRYASAMESIVARGGGSPSQLVVRKRDGSTLMCERLADFSKASFGPCLLGPDGSVALYVTDYKSSGAEEWEKVPVAEPDWGPALTCIPASEVAEIEIRFPTIS